MRFAAIVLCACALLATTARAEETENDDVTKSREAFVLGTALAKKGQWREALAEFERSAALRPHPVTTYNVAFCERALGRYTRAREMFAAAIRAGELPEDLARSAGIYRLEADRLIARVAVTIEPPDAALSVDGRPLARAEDEIVAGIRPSAPPERPPSSSASFVLRIDPGPHIFIVARPGGAQAVVERSFEPGATGALELRAPAPRAVEKVAPSRKRAVVHETEMPYGKTPGYVVLGAGAALLTTGGALGIAFLVNRADLEDVCTDAECPTDRERQIDVTNALGTASIVTLAVGGAALGTGIALAITGRSKEQAGAIAPWVGFGSGGLRAAF